MSNKKTILVEIPAYRDAQLIPTIQSAIFRAEFPDRVHFAICFQEDDWSDYEKIKDMPNMSIKALKCCEAKGLGYARSICQQMLNGEDFILHIDSHMRFVQNWDSALIKEFENLNDPKAIISTYLPNINEDKIDLPPEHPFFDEPADGTVLRCSQIFPAEGHHARFKPRKIRKFDTLPKRNIWISGHFLFAKSEYDKDVPANPDSFFVQDELSIAVRTFTHGYNIYNPEKLYIYHWYHRNGRYFPQDKNRKQEEEQVCALFGIKENESLNKKYGFGKERTLEEFEQISGLYIKECKLYAHSRLGLFYDIPQEFITNKMLPREKEVYEDTLKIRNGIIHVCIIGRNATSVNDCIQSAKSTAYNSQRLNFHIVLSEQERKYQGVIDETADIIYVDDNATYGKRLASIDFHSFDKNDFVLCIDSETRFCLPDKDYWDFTLINRKLYYGDNAILTCYIFREYDNQTVTVRKNEKLIVEGMKETVFVYNSKEVTSQNTPEFLLRDGFIFTLANTFQKVPIDHNLAFNTHLIAYSARLWTNGFDIYYPQNTFFYRNSGFEFLEEFSRPKHYYGVMGHVFSRTWLDALSLIEEDYPFELGKARRLILWYQGIGYNYHLSEKL